MGCFSSMWVNLCSHLLLQHSLDYFCTADQALQCAACRLWCLRMLCKPSTAMQALSHARAGQVCYERRAGRLTIVACWVQDGPLPTLHNRKVARPQIAMQQRWLHLHRHPPHASYANISIQSPQIVATALANAHQRREDWQLYSFKHAQMKSAKGHKGQRSRVT